VRARDADPPSSRWRFTANAERNTEVLCCSAERHHMIIPADKNGISLLAACSARVAHLQFALL
jgi:hypothetical protein